MCVRERSLSTSNMVALRGETRTLNLEVWTVRRDDRRWNVESISVSWTEGEIVTRYQKDNLT